MENKHYILEDVSWWYSNGCSCCEPLLMEAYNFRDEKLNYIHGTVTRPLGIALVILIHNKHVPEDYYEDNKWDDYDFLKLANDLGYSWEIVDEMEYRDGMC